MDKTLFIFDIDNTLVTSYGIYDEAYRLTTLGMLGKEFIMTKNPDGTPDLTFSKKSNPEILATRLKQLDVAPDTVDESLFWKKFDENAEKVAKTSDFVIFPGVQNFIHELAKSSTLVLLTSGPRKLQTTVLKRAKLADYFDLQRSLFLGDFKTKQEAIEHSFSNYGGTRVIVHAGDAPKDMIALREANVTATKIAVGVIVGGLSTSNELKQAGADAIIKQYDSQALNEVAKLCNLTEDEIAFIDRISGSGDVFEHAQNKT